MPANLPRWRKAKPREFSTEDYLCDEVRVRGGKAYKMNATRGLAKMPDRHCRLPDAIEFYVEVKRTGQVPTPGQEEKHRELRALGARVYVVDSREGVDDVLRVELPE